VLVSGCQNNVTFFKALHTRTNYFSRENRVVNIDNLVPYDELSTDRSVYLIGKDRDTVRINVIITPMQQGLTQDPPEFEFK
jgi:BTB/POZ domain-containing protein 17